MRGGREESSHRKEKEGPQSCLVSAFFLTKKKKIEKKNRDSRNRPPSQRSGRIGSDQLYFLEGLFFGSLIGGVRVTDLRGYESSEAASVRRCPGSLERRSQRATTESDITR